ncbi:MAG TPA: CHAT domain-containing protein, partial [Hyalangium sp.]|nr:CHAT domain-containing protein [Hyalangium sp.]
VEEIANASRAINHSLGGEDRKTFEQLQGLRTQLATLSYRGPGSLSPAEYQQRLRSLSEEGDALETQLTRRSASLRALSALPSPADIVDRVAAALPKDGALVEFVAYRDRPVVPKPGTPLAQLPGELRYLALVLLPNSTLHTVDLGPIADIDQAASTFREALASSGAAWQGPARALHSRVYLPLRPLLGNARRLFLSPDGQLNLVPFAALHDGRRILVDAFDITYLTSGKELLPRPEDTAPTRLVVVVADPDLDSPSTEPLLVTQTAADPVESAALPERVDSSLRAELADRPFPPLPGTRKEAEAIKSLFPEAQLLLGSAATKEALLKLHTPDILHIATHGFFLGDTATPHASRAVGNIGAVAEAGPLQSPPDPLLRSGLVLAPAQDTAAPSGSRRYADSLVTALELAGLDLWGTQLVVLSACDTGRGDVKLGQGVYGLRRALLVAGAETVVTSLWKVNDETTRELMEAYYRHLLAGHGRTTALRRAMLELRQKWPHPHNWAPFISLGQDAPLRRLAPGTPSQPTSHAPSAPESAHAGLVG